MAGGLAHIERAAGFRLLILACALAWLSGCASGPGKLPSFGPEADFEVARQEFDRGHLVAAIEHLESFERNHPGSQFIDDALYYLGLARQKNNEYLLARQAFGRVVDDYPRSPLVEDARFETARSWFLAVRGAEHDAEPAEEALKAFQAYLRRYPEGKQKEAAEKAIADVLGTLARKDFLNGETYMRLGRLAAARRYFEKSLVTWADSPVSARALDGIARTFEKEENWSEARRSYERLAAHLGADPARFTKGGDLARRAREKLAELPAATPAGTPVKEGSGREDDSDGAGAGEPDGAGGAGM